MLLPAAPLPCHDAATIAQTIGTAAERISGTTAEATEKHLCSMVKTKAFSAACTLVLYLPDAL